MDDEINGASGNQSPELLAVVGSEALDFAHCETEDVDLDFGDDLEAEEEAEQAAVGSASSFGYRESSFSSNNSTPSKHSRMPAERQSHIARWVGQTASMTACLTPQDPVFVGQRSKARHLDAGDTCDLPCLHLCWPHIACTADTQPLSNAICRPPSNFAG
jgi:hypothetical protein